ncbi:alpha/beta fold hydrolase [Nitrosomonas marina]|uniref:Pimeloyl-ACP methyl ester carboxylesterase n=1 Tax=Nitrosomonas marina TaxID=917 RepID=A0A1H8BE72_9PROT|nr:alpha/beta hydrolase [Nitrosomonas marina]SEM80434.1 Pimeloyl-ACP methyl ester carboxylesterase [Nitrosomonas marina]
MQTPQFVLIRGLLRDARHWGEFKHVLQRRFPRARILTPDIPGNGKLNHLTSPKTIADMTEALRGQIGQQQGLRLIAISMGGMIAIDWMTRYPDEVRSAVLINTSLKNFSPFYHRLRWTAYPRVAKMILTAILQKKIDIEADILALTSNCHGGDQKLLSCWQRWQQQHPVSLSNAIHQCLAAASFTNLLRLNRPVLVITSMADRLVDYHCSARLARVLQTDYVQHATAGHDLPLDEPEWLVNAIGAWLHSHKADR